MTQHQSTKANAGFNILLLKISTFTNMCGGYLNTDKLGYQGKSVLAVGWWDNGQRFEQA